MGGMDEGLIASLKRNLVAQSLNLPPVFSSAASVSSSLNITTSHNSPLPPTPSPHAHSPRAMTPVTSLNENNRQPTPITINSTNGGGGGSSSSRAHSEDGNQSPATTPCSAPPAPPSLPPPPGVPPHLMRFDLHSMHPSSILPQPSFMAGNRIPKSDPLEGHLQDMLRYNMEKYAGQALDTLSMSRRVRELLSIHNIGQRLFAKYVLGLSQGTVSELLSKPKNWEKLTEKGRDSYRKMHAWAYDDQAVMMLKSLIPRKGELSRSTSRNVFLSGMTRDEFPPDGQPQQPPPLGMPLHLPPLPSMVSNKSAEESLAKLVQAQRGGPGGPGLMPSGGPGMGRGMLFPHLDQVRLLAKVYIASSKQFSCIVLHKLLLHIQYTRNNSACTLKFVFPFSPEV